MSIQHNTDQQILFDISTIIKDISQGIKDLEYIISLVNDEKEIIPFEQSYCNQCKEPCGRSNAEILKCITARKNITNKKRQVTNQQYTKEHLEQDLNKIINDFQKKEKHLKQIMEKIQKGIAHS